MDLRVLNLILELVIIDKGIDTKDYVLGNISKEDKDTLNNLYKDLCLVVDDYFHMEFPDLMNKYNRKNR